MYEATLLIVDDEPANLAVLARSLFPRYRVRAVNSGESALRAVRSDPRPDLILLDVMMPEMDGFTVLSRLRDDPSTRDIPVIFVTALTDEVNEEYGFSLGAVDYITKPVRHAIVMARVQAQLELKQARDRLKNENAWLEAEVARRLKDNLLIQDAALCTLAELAETRDAGNGNHILRTQSYVEVLARRLQRAFPKAEELAEPRLIHIVKAAPLHDIGKVGIPDRILLKPSTLTGEEFAVIKTHCRIGSDAIAKAMKSALDHNGQDTGADGLQFLEIARIIALSHHERWDGNGYPEGLAAAAIPLPARMMAVADVFDALTTRRAYRTPIDVEEAIAYIRANAGTQFDPEIATALVGSFDEIVQIHDRLADS